MTSIETNRAAVRVLYHGNKNQNNENKAYARLASGTRVTDASDDAAGLFVANRMKVQILGIERAVKNSFDGISLVNAAEANLNEIRNMVLRMREILSKWPTAFVDNEQDFEIELSVIQQVDLIAKCQFNEVLLDGTMQNVGIQTGPTANGAQASLKTSSWARY